MSPSASEVSIVTVNWNGRHHLETLLPSLLPLGCQEIIVVDNGSTDGSQQFLSRLTRVKLIQNQENRGFAHPVNQAAVQAQGRYLAIINNDMRAHPRWIDAALERIGKDTPCIASRILDWEGTRIDFNGSSLHYLGYALQQDTGKPLDQVSSPDFVLFPCGGAMLVERNFFLGLGGFDEDFFAIFEDVDFGWRVWISGFQVAMAPQSIAFHRGHGTFKAQPLPKMRYLMHRNALMTILKNYEDQNFSRILPLALILGLKRAVRLSGVQKESFYLWTNASVRLKNKDEFLERNLWDALNHIVSIEDVLSRLPSITHKRKVIARFRQRGDSEIFKLFNDPFRHIVEDPVYLKDELKLLDFLDLTSAFKAAYDGATLQQLPEVLREKIESLEQELRALQWWGIHAVMRAPRKPDGGLRSMVRSLRALGARESWRRLREKIENGI
ncbi:MAG: glycosyltransferase family 2 protein [Acidobacteria bacterium]|nr:glycosyltransferase family 2 protein [Acidobacteriota bacterium]